VTVHEGALGTVHRLEAENVIFAVFDDEHVLLIVLPVTRLLPQFFFDKNRGENFVVIGTVEHVADKFLQFLVHDHSAGQPEHGAGRHVMEGKEIEFSSELAVISLFRFLEALEVFFEFLFLREGNAVDALELLILRIAFPVRAGNVQQLHVLDASGRRKMRTAAEIGKRPFFVAADDLVLFVEALYQLNLVLIAFAAPEIQRFLLAELAANEGLVFPGQFHHARFDAREVLGGEHVVDVDIVVKTLLDGRTDSELRTGKISSTA
jgi:hypothetical protein